MRRWFSPKITGSVAAFFMGIPERVEIEPLHWCIQAARRQAIGVTLHPLLYNRVALAAPPLDAFDEGLQIDVKTFALFQAEQKVGGALQQERKSTRLKPSNKCATRMTASA